MDARLLHILVTSFPKILIPGIKVTIPLTAGAFTFSFIFGLLLALCEIGNVKSLKHIAHFYIWIFRGTPLLVQLFIIFFGLPSFGIMLDAIPAAIIAFGMNLSAYNAEVFKASILAVPQGQREAAEMIGMNPIQVYVRIILPQAFVIAFPSLFNNLISLVKDTSLASSITVIELFTTAEQIAARTFEPFALYCEAGLIYLIICSGLTYVQRTLEKKMQFVHKEAVSNA